MELPYRARRRRHATRLQRRDRAEVDLIGDRCIVREKHRIEFRAFRDLCDANVVGDIDEGARIRVPGTPCGRDKAGVEDIDVQM